MEGLRAAKSEERETLLGLKPQVEEAVTGTWEDESCGEGPLPTDLAFDGKTQPGHSDQARAKQGMNAATSLTLFSSFHPLVFCNYPRKSEKLKRRQGNTLM